MISIRQDTGRQSQNNCGPITHSGMPFYVYSYFSSMKNITIDNDVDSIQFKSIINHILCSHRIWPFQYFGCYSALFVFPFLALSQCTFCFAFILLYFSKGLYFQRFLSIFRLNLLIFIFSINT